ncbi:MAG TPA: VWA domain-containing protein [Nannocystaceae bacterium]|nr:VWA domain-containing protein [Nannocystaceae bacterium]
MSELLSHFAHPGLLWLALPIIGLLVYDLLRRWGDRPVKRVFAAIVRTVGMLALVGALADPRWHRHEDVAHVVFVVDRSASVPDAALQQAIDEVERLRGNLPSGVRTGLVLFDAAPELAVLPGAPWQIPSPLRATAVDGSDIDAAIAIALSLVPDGEGGEIVLLSDGRRSAFDPSLDARAMAEARGVPVDTFVVDPARNDPAVLAVTVAEPQVRPGATASGKVELVGGDVAQRGTVTVKVGDKVALTQVVDIPAGESIEVPFSHALDPKATAGTQPVEATLELEQSGDVDPGNNRGATSLVVGDPPKVRVVTGEEADGGAIARALRAERMDVEVVKASELQPAQAKLDDIDLVVLANAPAQAIAGERGLSDAFMGNLTRWVDGGGGLIVLGGPMAYDMGGYGDTPLEKILPVKIDPVEQEIESAASILIILDRSGSMSAMAGWSKTKMELADEGAVASIRLLRPFDQVGVMSVTEEVRWEVNMQPLADGGDIERKVLRIRADGGGIFVYTSLEAAHAAMRKVDTPLRHVILFSDAADSEEKVDGIPFGLGEGDTSEALARRMRDEGITTSVIGIGTEEDIDTQFLKDLAKSGGGRFYLTADASKLRSLFVQETERLVDSSLKEVPFRPVALARHAALEGIDYQHAPHLKGYQQLEARPTAEIVMAAAEGHPLMVTWRYGLGHVIAWASDAGPRWADEWLTWPGYNTHWTQLARFALRSGAGSDTAIEVAVEGGQALVRVARRDDKGMTIDDGTLRARLVDGDDRRDLKLRAREPGLWDAGITTQSGHTYTVEVLGADDKVIARHSFAPPPSIELRHRTPDKAWLTELSRRSGGRFEPEAVTPKVAASVTADVTRLWPLLLGLALMLLPLDAFLRRQARVV